MFISADFTRLSQHRDYLDEELVQVRCIKSLLTQYVREMSACGNESELRKRLWEQAEFMRQAENRILCRRDVLIQAEQLLSQSRDELAKSMDDAECSIRHIALG